MVIKLNFRSPIVNSLIFPSFWVSGEGDYSVDFSNADYSHNGSLNGTLTHPDFVLEDISHWLDANAGLTFNLQLSGLPKASVTISGDRTAYQAGKATVTIAYGTRQIILNGDIANNNLTGSVDVTNQDGVTMTLSSLDSNAKTGAITYNGTTFATLSSMSNGLTKITYNDGTFETF